jgi:hypothetical protein
VTESFGRRRFVLPPPPPARASAPPSVADPAPAPRPVWRPEPDPELEAWKASRSRGLWLRMLTPWVLVLGGPMSFFMPEGIGQLLGIGASLIGGYGLWRRWRPGAKV